MEYGPANPKNTHSRSDHIRPQSSHPMEEKSDLPPFRSQARPGFFAPGKKSTSEDISGTVRRLFDIRKPSSKSKADLGRLKKAKSITHIQAALRDIDNKLQGVFPNHFICTETIRALGRV